MKIMTSEIAQKISAGVLQRLSSNKHASWSVAAFVALEGLNKVLDLWFPIYAMKFDETIRICSKAVVAYALLMTAHQPPPKDAPLTPPPAAPTNPT